MPKGRGRGGAREGRGNLFTDIFSNRNPTGTAQVRHRHPHEHQHVHPQHGAAPGEAPGEASGEAPREAPTEAPTEARPGTISGSARGSAPRDPQDENQLETAPGTVPRAPRLAPPGFDRPQGSGSSAGHHGIHNLCLRLLADACRFSCIVLVDASRFLRHILQQQLQQW